ncbi:WD40 repeat domain-containing protein [Sphingomonas sp. RT2P30]|uniref:WD40 repeat domain-containing protein n=1 Tax=Parasphingomonas halimpatiens TaxID=3096162 RepID=UPI002FCA3B40
MAKRANIKGSVQDAILVESRRRCCICFGLNRDFARKKGQLAHLDGNRANSAESNLVFLCLEHHDEFDSRTSQSKNLTRGEVRKFRSELYNQIELVFRQDGVTQQIEVMGFPDSFPATGTTETSLCAPGDVSAPGPPSRWSLRYHFEFSNAAWLGRFSEDNREIMVAESNNGSWHFKDSVDDFWQFQIPEDLRNASEKSGTEMLAGFIGKKSSVNIYPRINGNLSVATITYTEHEYLDTTWETLEAHRTRPCFAGFTPDGTLLLTGDEAGELLIWDWPARRKMHRLPCLVGPIASANLNYGIDRAIVTGRNGAFEIFELSTSRSLSSGAANVKGDSAQVHFSLDPAYLVAHDGADRFQAFDATTLALAPDELWPKIWVNIKSSDDVQVLAVWTVTGAILAAVRETQEPVGREAFEMLSPPSRRVSDYQISPDGERIALIIERRNLQVWERVPR